MSLETGTFVFAQLPNQRIEWIRQFAGQHCACIDHRGPAVTVNDLTGFAGAIEEAVVAVLDAIVSAGEERRGHLKKAKLAVEQALRDSRSGEEWNLADHLRLGIRDVELSAWDVA